MARTITNFLIGIGIDGRDFEKGQRDIDRHGGDRS